MCGTEKTTRGIGVMNVQLVNNKELIYVILISV